MRRRNLRLLRDGSRQNGSAKKIEKVCRVRLRNVASREAPDGVSRLRERLADTRKRIFVVDDQPIVWLGVRGLLEPQKDLMVCGTATLDSAIAPIGELQPDVVLADLGKEVFSVGFIGKIKAVAPEAEVLAFSRHDEPLYAELAFVRGAMGFVKKTDRPKDLVEAIRTVAHRQVYVSSGVGTRPRRGEVSSLPCVAGE